MIDMGDLSLEEGAHDASQLGREHRTWGCRAQGLISFRKMPYTIMMRRRGRYGVPMQTYGSIIPGGPTLARLLPEGAQEGREEPRLSREAKARLRAVEWHKDHGEKVSLTARRFGRSRSTLYQWLECYRLQGPRGLEDRSHRPTRSASRLGA